MIIAINGSPREDWNTGTLLDKALEGAKNQGAQTEFVSLYQLQMLGGCVSCFACKRKGGKPGRCAMRDELAPVLERIKNADALILGSPIYWWDVTAGMRAFLERFLFSNMLYNKDQRWVFPKKLPSALFYTWGAEWDLVKTKLARFKETEDNLADMLGFAPLTLHSVNAWQFDDYSRYEADRFDLAAKQRHKEEVFPQDCEKAMKIGAELAKTARGLAWSTEGA